MPDYSDLSYSTSQLDENITNSTSHMANTVIHCTSYEKSTWNAKQDALTFDALPTNNSSNPVTSGGVYDTVNAIAVKIGKMLGIGIAISSGTDLDSITTPDTYTCEDAETSATLIHNPCKTAGFRLEVKYLSDDTCIRQTMIPAVSDGSYYVRNKIGGSWGLWYVFSGSIAPDQI